MRKILPFLCIFGLLLLSAAPLYAGGIINKQNLSADYMRTLNRHAAIDYSDIAVYNPAGIMQLDSGAYAKLDILYFDKDYSNTVPDTAFGVFNQPYGELNSTKPSVIPGAFAIYKKERWAGFFAFTIPAGGGELDYSDGNARTIQLASGIAANANALLAGGGAPPAAFYNQIDAMNIKVKESSVLGFTVGGSFAINEMWSVAAGVRYADGTREFDGSATISATGLSIPGTNDPITADIELEQEADGWAGILGVNFRPNDKLNTALTFISSTKLDYLNKVKRDTVGIAPSAGFADGTRNRIDIPGLLGFGVSYKFIPQLKVDLNYVHYFEKSATIDTFENEGDSWDLGISAEYTFTPQWKASLGYLRTDIKIDADQQINEPEEPKLDANTVALGAVWSPTPAWAITFGGAYVMYDDVTDSIGINYDKEVWNVSLGAQWKFF